MARFAERGRQLAASWRRFARTGRGRTIAGAGRLVVLVATFALLAASLRGIDWTALQAALPDRPAFYVLVLVSYLWLPASDLVAYRMLWTFQGWRSLLAFVTKRIYNREVLQYSGEFVFFGWARRSVGGSSSDLARTIRDQNIIQSIASTGVALVLVAGFLMLAGRGRPGGLDLDGRWAGAGMAVGALLGLALWWGRRWLAMNWRTTRRMLGVHSLRFVVEQALQIWMWAAAVPGVALGDWLVYAAVSVVISRIPLVTNRDVVFASVGIGIAAKLALPTEAVAATMLMTAGLGKVVSAGFMVLSWVTRATGKAGGAEHSVAAPPARNQPDRPMVSIGLTPAARRAGNQHAARATASNTTIATANASGSVGVT